MKLAFIVQRYGLEIIGGAEYFTRLMAEHLKDHYSIEVLTTCAKNYHNWNNEYPEGIDEINGIIVRRFKTDKSRDMNQHIMIQEKVFFGKPTFEEEIKWIEEQGPHCPELIEFIKKNNAEYDFFLFFTFRYYPSFFGIPEVSEKAILVPFAENDPALDLNITKYLFDQVLGIIYCTPEEKDLIQQRVRFNDKGKISDIIGCGIDLPNLDILSEPGIPIDYFLYIGRIEGSKGCYQLFEFYLALLSESNDIPALILGGFDGIEIPKNNNIKYLGFVSEQVKFSLLKNAYALIMPSPLESFSLITLESMSCGTPVVVNGECDVLKGHCVRSNAGLWYANYDEFKEIVRFLISDDDIRNILGKNGIEYIKKNYSWRVVINKFINFIENASIK